MAWEYQVESVKVIERWSQKKQAEEVASFQSSLNAKGRENWEMVSFETIPLTGSFSGNVKGYVYLVFWKRPA
jgi:hypothetical protein